MSSVGGKRAWSRVAAWPVAGKAALWRDRVRAAWVKAAQAKEEGMTTAEYAVGTVAACAFAAVLLAIVRSGGISNLVTSIIEAALGLAL